MIKIQGPFRVLQVVSTWANDAPPSPRAPHTGCLSLALGVSRAWDDYVSFAVDHYGYTATVDGDGHLDWRARLDIGDPELSDARLAAVLAKQPGFTSKVTFRDTGEEFRTSYGAGRWCATPREVLLCLLDYDRDGSFVRINLRGQMIEGMGHRGRR